MFRCDGCVYIIIYVGVIWKAFRRIEMTVEEALGALDIDHAHMVLRLTIESQQKRIKQLEEELSRGQKL